MITTLLITRLFVYQIECWDSLIYEYILYMIAL